MTGYFRLDQVSSCYDISVEVSSGYKFYQVNLDYIRLGQVMSGYVK
jgi:hypothetical protein